MDSAYTEFNAPGKFDRDIAAIYHFHEETGKFLDSLYRYVDVLEWY